MKNNSEVDAFIQQRIKSGRLVQAQLQGTNLEGVDFKGCDLSGSNLAKANLTGANLSGVNLCKADLSGANLQNASFEGANLQDANLEQANLQDASFKDAILKRANINGADVRGTDLSVRSYSKISMENIVFDINTTWTKQLKKVLSKSSQNQLNAIQISLCSDDFNVFRKALDEVGKTAISTEDIYNVLKIRKRPQTLEKLKYALQKLRFQNYTYNWLLGEFAKRQFSLVADCTHLSITHNGRPLPSSLSHLSTLEHLQGIHFGSKKLSRIPKWVYDLSHLRKLNLGGNRISEIPKQITQLTQLEELSLYQNKLSDLPEEILQLSNLKILNLSNNPFPQLPSVLERLCMRFSIQEGLPILTTVKVEQKRIEEYTQIQLRGIYQAIQKDPSLKDKIDILDLENCFLTSLPDIVEHISPRIIRLKNNELKEFPEVLLKIPLLEELDLSENQITALPTHINSLERLRIDVRENPLQHLELDIPEIHLSTEQWIRFHEHLIKSKRMQRLFISTTRHDWNEKSKAVLRRQFEKRKRYEKELQTLMDSEAWKESDTGASGGWYAYYISSSLTYVVRQKLKDIWRRHANRTFFNEEMLAIHWIGWLNGAAKRGEGVQKFLSHSPPNTVIKDEVSAHGYFMKRFKWESPGRGRPKHTIGVILKQKQITYASNADLYSEELRQKDHSKVIQNPDGSIWRPDAFSKDKIEAALKNEGTLEHVRTPGYAERVMPYFIQQEQKKDPSLGGRRLVSLETLHAQSGLPKHPSLLLGARSYYVLIDKIDVRSDGFVFEMLVDNWVWDTLIVSEESLRQELRAMLPKEVHVLSIAEYFLHYK